MNPKMVLTVTGIFFGSEGLASDGMPEISDKALWLGEVHLSK